MARTQNELEGIIQAKALVLLQRERELDGLRQAHHRTSAWLHAFHALRPEHGCEGAAELCAEWAERMERDLFFQSAAVYRKDKGEFVLSSGVSRSSAVPKLTIDAELRRYFNGHPNGVAENPTEPALLGLGDSLRLSRFVWFFAAQSNGSEHLMVAGLGEADDAQAPHSDEDFEHFEMLARHLAALLLNAELVTALENERLELRASLLELKRTQEQLVSASSLAAVGQLAAGVAHEINNPLTYVMSNLEITESELGDFVELLPQESGQELLQMIGEARVGAERIRNVVRDLKTLSKGASDDRARVDLRRVLEFAVNVTANEIRHRAVLVRDVDYLPPVVGSESRLGQVFVNLLLNAAQSIPEGHVDAHQIRVVGRRRGAHVVIEIHDTGEGISSALLPKIFEPFFSTRSTGRGTGLGLSICDSVVRGLGGSIEVESELEKGSMFRVILPSAGSFPSPLRTAAEPGSRRGKILIVDDEPLVAQSFRRMLARWYSVDTEHDGRRVLERLSSGERFDAILCDMMMPELTGSQLFAEIQKLAPDQAASVIFITGGAFTESTSQFLDQVENPVLEKPVALGDLRPLLDELIGARTTRA